VLDELSRPRGTTSNDMPTIRSRPITGGSNIGTAHARGLRTDRTPQVIISGLAFMQNLRRGHYELATETARPLRVAAAFTALASAI
jgi:hypothetical protein